ncbi:pantoate--beta-alanine ligase [Bathymodiolus japonicus methanotrophic gill symbiont]|uniref:pantoate--beta-alanine ligase n=1 Tax=Bathymodiolus japonicus methanotrophic gill symbiont TaxID=113269 RepID=UPI001B726A3D|nr:pantoate--beta-alanine ligase [Bathymodiolus japonicus methanotrophic gill symbiont]GFO72967.1 pantoate--beta-alanine ligase [Bathymodiolus japonicus methanotrophic gill symbiont]
MLCINKIKPLRVQIKQWRMAGECIAFVPTMGNLHAGHLQLVKAAKAQADRVVVSIFVNPTQFNEQDDFANYPRTEEADLAKLQSVGIDLLYMPEREEMYPAEILTRVSVSQVSEEHCGAARPGHFDGVATVVTKLFNIVQPDKAFFGEKDFQQLMIIRAMVTDLNSSVDIIAVATFRESDGLAMSSRNTHLSEVHRQQAVQLYQALCQAKQAVLEQQTSFAKIEQSYLQVLIEQGFKPDYFTVCRRHDLKAATSKDTQLIILAAARLCNTRLIDNIQLDLEL